MASLQAAPEAGIDLREIPLFAHLWRDQAGHSAALFTSVRRARRLSTGHVDRDGKDK
jgi:hypothetical protein